MNVPVVPPVISHFSQSPNPICRGSWGNVYVHLSQGNGNLSYTWTPDPPYLQYEPHGSYCTVWIPNSAMNPENETYALYCTVSNGAGSANGNTLIFHTVCTGCPTLAFDVGGEMTDDNPLIITSLSNPGVDVTDFYLVQNPVTPVGSKINLRIHEPQTEHTWLDYVELIEAKVKSDELVAVNDVGEVINYKATTPALTVLLNDTTDITPLLAAMDTLEVSLTAGDVLIIQRTRLSLDGDGDMVLGGEVPPPAKDSPTFLIRLAAGDKVRAENTNDGAGYSPIGELFFRPNKSIIAKKLKNLPPGNLEIVINKDLTLNYLAIVNNFKTAKVNSLSLLNANHQQAGDVKNLLLGIDKNYAEIFPGDIIDFEFQKGTIPAEKTAYILKSVGRYETDTSSAFNKTTSAKQENLVPIKNQLFENYPNPFNPTTQIKYAVKENGLVTLKVYDVLGKEVAGLINEEKPAGEYTVTFDAGNLSSGIYFFTLTAKEFQQTKKMILVK